MIIKSKWFNLKKVKRSQNRTKPNQIILTVTKNSKYLKIKIAKSNNTK